MSNSKRATDLYSALTTECYYGFNFAVVLSKASDAELKTIEAVVARAKQAREALAKKKGGAK